MSLVNNYQQKYLKYKSKYLTLKNQLSSKNVMNGNVMNGGSGVSKIKKSSILALNELTITPTMTEVYGYNIPNSHLKGGMNNNKEEHKSDIKKLSLLLENSESALSNLSSELSEVKKNLDSNSEVSEIKKKIEHDSELSEVKSEKDDSSSSTTCSKSDSSSCSKSESEKIEDKEEISQDDTMEGGMKKENKKKHHKKHFFDDSDLDLNSTTESYLSSLESDSI